jgi:hypothetical protein
MGVRGVERAIFGRITKTKNAVWAKARRGKIVKA